MYMYTLHADTLYTSLHLTPLFTLQGSWCRVLHKVFITICPFWQVKYCKYLMKNTCPNDIFTCPSKEDKTYKFVLKVAFPQYTFSLPNSGNLYKNVLGLSKCLPECDFYLPRAIGQICAYMYVVLCGMKAKQSVPKYNDSKVNNGPDRYLNCAIQITHRDVILRTLTHGPKYRHSNDHSNCAIQVTGYMYASRCKFAYTQSKIPYR